MPAEYSVLGTDGLVAAIPGEALRNFFEVDRYFVVVSALEALANQGELPRSQVVEAMHRMTSVK